MRAIGLTEYGGPEVLHEVDLPQDPLEPEVVRIRVRAAAVNPTDTMLRSGARDTKPAPDDGPAVPGMDAAGTVLEVGEDVDTGIEVGDRVCALVVPAGRHGAYREDLVVPAASVVTAPTRATDSEAATLLMNALTARLALDSLALDTGDVLAVTGAAGAFGGYVVQLGKARGLTVVADAAQADEELVRELGADVVVPRGDDIADRIRERFADGVDGLADGSVQESAVLAAVRDGGRVATVRGYDGAEQDRVAVEPVLVVDSAQRHDLLEELRDRAEQGQLTLRVADVLPADEAAEAHHRLEAGGVRGRLVLAFD